MAAKKTKRTVTPVPANGRPASPARRGKARRAPAAAAPPATQPEARKLSALDAAALVLAESGEPLSCPQLIAAMAEKGYWTSPAGKTPAATLYVALTKEIRTKGAKSRFAIPASKTDTKAINAVSIAEDSLRLDDFHPGPGAIARLRFPIKARPRGDS
jgi:hypothetical protein